MSQDWWWFDDLLQILALLAMYWLGWRHHKKHTENPYEGECMYQGCKFTCSSNSWELVMRMMANHERDHHASTS